MKSLLFFVAGLFFVSLYGFSASHNEDERAVTDFNHYITKEDIFLEQIYHSNEETLEVESPTQKEIIPQPRGRWIWAKVTAYTNGPESCGPYADGFTSIMVNTNSTNPNNVYGIAANPRVIPYGTSVYIEGYWEMLQGNRNLVPTEMTKIDDTGSAMRRFRPHWRTVNGQRVWVEAHLDVRVRQVRTALNWGVKYMKVFVYE